MTARRWVCAVFQDQRSCSHDWRMGIGHEECGWYVREPHPDALSRFRHHAEHLRYLADTSRIRPEYRGWLYEAAHDLSMAAGESWVWTCDAADALNSPCTSNHPHLFIGATCSLRPPALPEPGQATTDLLVDERTMEP